jgi:hypothetical protein
LILPDYVSQHTMPHDVQLLIRARWEEHLIEDIVLAKASHGIPSEGFHKLLIKHRLERARLEVGFYTAVAKAGLPNKTGR